MVNIWLKIVLPSISNNVTAGINQLQFLLEQLCPIRAAFPQKNYEIGRMLLIFFNDHSFLPTIISFRINITSPFQTKSIILSLMKDSFRRKDMGMYGVCILSNKAPLNNLYLFQRSCYYVVALSHKMLHICDCEIITKIWRPCSHNTG